MTKYLASPLLLLLCLQAYSQKGKLQLKFCPLSAIDPASFPTIQGGLEIKLSKRFSWYNEAGIKYLKTVIGSADTSFVRSRGFKIKSEARYYFNDKYDLPLNGFYAAGNFFLTRDWHNTKILYYTPDDSLTTKTDNFGVRKTVLGGNILLGYEEPIGSRFAIDLYAGLGVRFRNIITSHEDYRKDIDRLITSIDLNIADQERETDADGGHSTVPNFTFGFRICYRL